MGIESSSLTCLLLHLVLRNIFGVLLKESDILEFPNEVEELLLMQIYLYHYVWFSQFASIYFIRYKLLHSVLVLIIYV